MKYIIVSANGCAPNKGAIVGIYSAKSVVRAFLSAWAANWRSAWE